MSTLKSHLLGRAKCIRRPPRVVKWRWSSGASRRLAGEAQLNCFKFLRTKTKGQAGWRSHLQPWNLAALGSSFHFIAILGATTSGTLAHKQHTQMKVERERRRHTQRLHWEWTSEDGRQSETLIRSRWPLTRRRLFPPTVLKEVYWSISRWWRP